MSNLTVVQFLTAIISVSLAMVGLFCGGSALILAIPLGIILTGYFLAIGLKIGNIGTNDFKTEEDEYEYE